MQTRLLRWLRALPASPLPPDVEAALRELIGVLCEAEDEDWLEPVEVLIQAGPDIAPLLAESLKNKRGPWWRIAAVLGGLGETRAAQLIWDALQEAEETWDLVPAMRLAGASARPIFTAKLEHPDGVIRSRALIGLGFLGEASVLPDLFALLSLDIEEGEKGDEIPSVAAEAIRSQGVAARPWLRPWLLTEARPGAELPLYLLIPFGADPALEEIVLDVAEKRPELLSHAWVALRHLHAYSPRTAALMISTLLDDSLSSHAREYAAKNIGWMGFIEAEPALTGLLEVAPSRLQDAVVEACGVLSIAAVAPRLESWLWQAIEGSDRDGCGLLATALGDIGLASSVPALTALLLDERDYPDHPYDHGREAAATALGQIGGDAAIDALLAALQRESIPRRRVRAALSLGLLQTPRAAPAARALLDASIPADLRGQLHSVIISCGTPEVDGPAFLDAWHHAETAHDACSAVTALGRLRPPGTLDVLRAGLHHEDAEVRSVSAATAGLFGRAAVDMLPCISARYRLPSLAADRRTLAVAIARISGTVSEEIAADVRHVLVNRARMCADHNNRLWRISNLELVHAMACALSPSLASRTAARQAAAHLGRIHSPRGRAELQAAVQAVERLCQ